MNLSMPAVNAVGGGLSGGVTSTKSGISGVTVLAHRIATYSEWAPCVCLVHNDAHNFLRNKAHHCVRPV
jgi:hypothetical protein